MWYNCGVVSASVCEVANGQVSHRTPGVGGEMWRGRVGKQQVVTSACRLRPKRYTISSAQSTMRVVDLSRRSFAAAAALFLTARPNTPAFAALSGGAASVEEQYKAGARADGGRGAAALVKPRSQSGIDRVGGSPMFKPGSILDAMRSEDKTIVDVSFAYPDKWTVSNGPNLDVRDIANSDSAFLLVTPLKGKSIADVKMKFFTDLIFDPAASMARMALSMTSRRRTLRSSS